MPTQPIGRRWLMQVAMAAATGLALAVGAAFLIEYLDDTVKTPDDVERTTKLPTLGAIVHFREAGSTEEGPMMAAHPKSAVAEGYRVLRTNLQFSTMDMGKSGVVLLVTSAQPTEGKTTSLVNLGVSLAQAGKQVVMVDTDLRRPALHEQFELSKESGLTSLLLEPEADLRLVVQETEVEGLRVLPSGRVPANPAEVLGFPEMSALLERLRSTADYVLLDSPPVLNVADASILAQKADGVLMVVETGRTRTDMLRRAVGLLEGVGARLLGVLLNKVSVRRGGYYDYYYYYYSGYYTDDEGVERKKKHRPSRNPLRRLSQALRRLLRRERPRPAVAGSPETEAKQGVEVEPSTAADHVEPARELAAPDLPADADASSAEGMRETLRGEAPPDFLGAKELGPSRGSIGAPSELDTFVPPEVAGPEPRIQPAEGARRPSANPLRRLGQAMGRRLRREAPPSASVGSAPTGAKQRVEVAPFIAADRVEPAPELAGPGLPADADALFAQGMTHTLRGEFQQAREHFLRAKELDPSRESIDALLSRLDGSSRSERTGPEPRIEHAGGSRAPSANPLSRLGQAIGRLLSIERPRTATVGVPQTVALQRVGVAPYIGADLVEPGRGLVPPGLEANADALFTAGMTHAIRGEFQQAREPLVRAKALDPSRQSIDALLGKLGTLIPPERVGPEPPIRPAWGARLRGRRWLAIGLVLVPLALAIVALIYTGILPTPFTAAGLGRSAEVRRHLNRGSALLATEMYEEAIDSFNMAVELDPGNVQARAGLQQAEEYLTIQELYAEATGLIEQNRHDLALGKLQEIIEVHPWYKNAGVLRARAEQYAEVDRLYQEGLGYYDAGEWAKAAVAFQAALDKDPLQRHGDIDSKLFDCYLNDGRQGIANALSSADIRQAAQSFEQALEIRPSDTEAKQEKELASLYADAYTASRLGDWRRAVIALTNVYAIRPDYAGGQAARLLCDAYMGLADEHRGAGDLELALDQYLVMLSMDECDEAEVRAKQQEVLELLPPPTPTPLPESQ